MDCTNTACSLPLNDGLPSYNESQRQARQGLRQIASIENRSQALYTMLRGEGYNNSEIKALLQHTITILPPNTKASILDQVKQSAYDKLLDYFQKKFGDKKFESMVANDTIHELELTDQSFSLIEILDENEIYYIAQSLLDGQVLQNILVHQDNLLDNVLTFMSAAKCDMRICQFLAMLNPETQIESVLRDLSI